MVQFSICKKHYVKQSAYEGAVQQDGDKLLSLARQLPTDCFDIQAEMFRCISDLMSSQGMVDEGIALLEEMYTRICEENGPADPVLQGIVSHLAGLLADSGGDLDRAERWASVAADNLRSYVRDSDPFKYWTEGCELATRTMGAIIKRTESEERKAALYQEAEGLLNDIISKSEEHFGADSYELGFALSNNLELRHSAYCSAEPATSSMDIALRAAGIYRRMELKEARYLDYFESLCHTAHALVRCYSDFISGKTSITPDEERKVVQAADFVIKEGRRQQHVKRTAGNTHEYGYCSFLDRAEALFFNTKTLAGRWLGLTEWSNGCAVAFEGAWPQH
jgi:hypothetical protein